MKNKSKWYYFCYIQPVVMNSPKQMQIQIKVLNWCSGLEAKVADKTGTFPNCYFTC